jgi:hypothetical protein
MLRLPKARVNAKDLDPYFVARHGPRLARAGEYILLDIFTDAEDGESTYNHKTSRISLAELAPLHAELMRGDLSPAYLAWLIAVGGHEVEDDAMEPPVPAGLTELTAAQHAMIEFLRIDVDLVGAAAETSGTASKEDAAFRRWLATLSAKKKDVWLKRAANEPELALGGELRRAFQVTVKRATTVARRTAGELRTLAKARRAAAQRSRTARVNKANAASGSQRRAKSGSRRG